MSLLAKTTNHCMLPVHPLESVSCILTVILICRVAGRRVTLRGLYHYLYLCLYSPVPAAKQISINQWLGRWNLDFGACDWHAAKPPAKVRRRRRRRGVLIWDKLRDLLKGSLNLPFSTVRERSIEFILGHIWQSSLTGLEYGLRHDTDTGEMMKKKRRLVWRSEMDKSLDNFAVQASYLIAFT